MGLNWCSVKSSIPIGPLRGPYFVMWTVKRKPGRGDTYKKRPKTPTLSRTLPSILGPCLGETTTIMQPTLFRTNSDTVQDILA